MAQQLKAPTVLGFGDRAESPSPNPIWVTPKPPVIPGGFTPSSDLHGSPQRHGIYSHRHTHLHINKNESRRRMRLKETKKKVKSKSYAKCICHGHSAR